MLQETFERSERILSITSAKLEQLVLTLFIKATCMNAPVVGCAIQNSAASEERFFFLETFTPQSTGICYLSVSANGMKVA
jgi:hypothetical protein